jgi:hypothetical protein
VEKVAVDVYLNPKRKPNLSHSRLRLVQLTQNGVLLGAVGRTTSKRAGKALEAAEQLDGSEFAAHGRARVQPIVTKQLRDADQHGS